MSTTPAPTDIASIVAELQHLTNTVHRLGQAIDRIKTPTAQVDTRGAAKLLGCSLPWIKELLSRGVFTDSRDSVRRRNRGRWMIFVDEIEEYQHGGAAAVRRFRAAMDGRK